MKVFAVVRQGDDLELVEWPSVRAFEAENSWIDDKWIKIGTSSQVKAGSFDIVTEGGFIKYTEEQKTAYMLMNNALKKG